MAQRAHPARARRGCAVEDGIRGQLRHGHGEKFSFAESVTAHRLIVDHEDAAAVRLRDPQRRRIEFEEPLVSLGVRIQLPKVAAPFGE
jgi:hypothetical protein